MRALLVVNARSRRGRTLGSKVRARLCELAFDFVEGEAEGQRSTVDCVVAAGGDGTVVRAIQDAIRLGVPLGVVPLGTFNDLARALSIPLDPERACDVVAAGVTRRIDVGRVNGAYFASEASIGISSRIARLQTPAGKQRFGWLFVIATALQSFRYARPMHVEVSFGDRTERLRAVQVTIANSNRFGGVIDVGEGAIDDGRLDLYAVETVRPATAFAVARAALSGRAAGVPGLHVFRSSSFTVRGRHPHHISADGEPAGTTPATFEVLPGGLRVFVPADQA